MGDEFINISGACRKEVGVISVLIYVETKERRNAPNGICVLRIANIIEKLSGLVINSSPCPTACGDASGFEIFFIIIVGTKVAINQFRNFSGDFAIAAEDIKIRFMVF